MNEPIVSFRGEHSFLSNFYQTEIEVTFMVADGHHETFSVPTLEHAYQLSKFEPYSAPFLAVLYAKTAGVAKTVANENKIHTKEDFHKNKVKIMADLIDQKFELGSQNALKLVLTEDSQLIEGNHWGDEFWGACKPEPISYRYVGRNYLGKLLMAKRSALLETYKYQFLSEKCETFFAPTITPHGKTDDTRLKTKTLEWIRDNL